MCFFPPAQRAWLWCQDRSRPWPASASLVRGAARVPGLVTPLALPAGFSLRITCSQSGAVLAHVCTWRCSDLWRGWFPSISLTRDLSALWRLSGTLGELFSGFSFLFFFLYVGSYCFENSFSHLKTYHQHFPMSLSILLRRDF